MMAEADIIQDYVLRHFTSVYAVPEVIVRELAARTSRVKWPDSGRFFFRALEPFPKDVRVIEMSGVSLPVFFFDQSAFSTQLVSRTGDSIQLKFDWVSASFYFLSGYQERFITQVERSRRTSASTFQAKYGILRKPIVDYYFSFVKEVLEEAYNVQIAFRASGPSLLVSHDIDSLRAGWKLETITAVQKRDLLNVIQILQNRARNKYPTDNIPSIVQLEQALGIQSTFFVLADSSPGNADYELSDPQVREALATLEDEGFEIAVHGSLGSHSDSSKLAYEKHRIPAEVFGNRFHYLHYDSEVTCEVVREAGLLYDASLGFFDYIGFRHGYCRPFELWSWAENAPSGIIEVPLHIMDTSYIERHYLGLPPDEAVEWTRAAIREVSRFSGGLSLLWHNNRFNSIAFAPWASAFLQGVKDALEAGYQSERHLDLAREYASLLSVRHA